MGHRQMLGLMLSVMLVIGLWAAPAALAQEKPQKGGVLRVALAGDPPSLDMHQESTFLVDIPFSTVYNTLVMYDPHGYPKIIGDLAKSWTVSDDKLTWTFTLHQGVTFHDDSPLTSADVKVSWDRIVFPPEGIVSPRRSLYTAVKSIEAPDPSTVVFHLKHPSPSFLTMLAHPANFIFAKKYLDQDPQYYRQHAMGSGPFKMKEYIRGASIEMVRNPKYWKQGLPHMDGIKYYIIRDDGARAKAIRSDRADVEFRGFAPAEVEAITKQLGNKVIAAQAGQPGHWGVAFNVDKKPFVGRGGSIMNISTSGVIGNIGASVPIRSYNDLSNGETVKEFVERRLRDGQALYESLGDSDGNVGIVVGSAGRNKAVATDPLGNPYDYVSQPAKNAKNGDLINVRAHTIMSAIAGSVDRIASIQLAQNIQVQATNVGTDKDVVGVPEFRSITGAIVPTPERDGGLIDGAFIAKKYVGPTLGGNFFPGF